MTAQCAVMPLSSDGNQARGGRWGSSGMKSVASNSTRGVTAPGGAGMPGIAAEGTPENT